VTQSLRPFSPTALRLLLEGTGLVLDTIEPDASEEHKERVPLEQAMFYLPELQEWPLDQIRKRVAACQ
jgi:hypothetical protein